MQLIFVFKSSYHLFILLNKGPRHGWRARHISLAVPTLLRRINRTSRLTGEPVPRSGLARFVHERAQRDAQTVTKGDVRLKQLLVFFTHILHLHLFINSTHQHCERLFFKDLNSFCGSFRRKFPPLFIL
jgi:hypothetical protein